MSSSSRNPQNDQCADGALPVLTELIVGFTGTREGLTMPQFDALKQWIEDRGVGELHHGDCVGADVAAHNFARAHRWRVVVHPGLGPKRLRAFVSGYNMLCPAKPNLERNADIVAACTILVACPNGPETLRSGTWSTVRRARKAKVPVRIIWPNGSVSDGAYRQDGTANAGPGMTSNSESTDQ